MADFSQAEAIEDEVRALLGPLGILPLGWFRFEGKKPALLLGNTGGSKWGAFSESQFFSDGAPDPLNRWTEAVVGSVAASIEAKALFPFGDKVWPFQRWAIEAMGVQSSPIGLLIHPEYGLWFALRGALVFDVGFEFPVGKASNHPCDTCVEKPCLNTCPVSAFSGSGYDVAACRAHVRSREGETCRNDGCLARRACPVGMAHQYGAGQQAFHMKHFLPEPSSPTQSSS